MSNVPASIARGHTMILNKGRSIIYVAVCGVHKPTKLMGMIGEEGWKPALEKLEDFLSRTLRWKVSHALREVTAGGERLNRACARTRARRQVIAWHWCRHFNVLSSRARLLCLQHFLWLCGCCTDGKGGVESCLGANWCLSASSLLSAFTVVSISYGPSCDVHGLS